MEKLARKTRRNKTQQPLRSFQIHCFEGGLVSAQEEWLPYLGKLFLKVNFTKTNRAYHSLLLGIPETGQSLQPSLCIKGGWKRIMASQIKSSSLTYKEHHGQSHFLLPCHLSYSSSGLWISGNFNLTTTWRICPKLGGL